MRRRWAWMAAGGGIVASTWSIACGPTETTCEESATCPTGAAGTGGAGGSTANDSGGNGGATGGDGGAREDVSTPADADASVDIARPDNVTADTRDADTRIDVSAEDTRRDTVDAPIVDVVREPDACDPGTAKSPVESACLISEKYGVFVSPQGNDATGAGTRTAPYKTLGKALQTAKGNGLRVYACDDGSGYTETVTFDAALDGVNWFGGFECSTWTYATTRRARVHPATGVPLTLKSLTIGTTIEDFQFDAANAAAGQSSFGVMADSAVNVVLRGVKVTAGKGGAGTDGADGVKGVDGPEVDTGQLGTAAKCPAGVSQQSGGSWSSQSTCGSRGGIGGSSVQATDGTNGGPGDPRTNVTPANIDNGGIKGSAGGDGDAGSLGNTGSLGTANAAVGTFSATGYVAADKGGDGKAGNVGQGGGGGGASNALPSSNCIGASGGAGGMGGCGGSPGKGGSSAGASVALLSWSSTITLDHCELIAGAGGNGGKGGNGGSGAGGNGGPSYGVVHKGTAPQWLNGTIVARGAGGAKGAGGTIDNVKAADGNPGLAADEFAVP
jgi:hypothetical protein